MNYKDFEDLGYEKALNKVFEIRKQRQKIYGNSWKDMENWEFYYLIKSKLVRLEYLLKYDNNNYENKIDVMIDMCNFILFMLEKNLDNEK